MVSITCCFSNDRYTLQRFVKGLDLCSCQDEISIQNLYYLLRIYIMGLFSGNSIEIYLMSFIAG